MSCCASVLILAVLGAAPVAETSPADGATEVDVATKAITITFDQPMDVRSMSVTGGGPGFPKLTAKPAWKDDRTLELAVTLEPGKLYTFGINGPNHRGFRSSSGGEATHRTVQFVTRAARGSESSPKANEAAIELLNQHLTRDYSYASLHRLDISETVSPKVDALRASTSPTAFAFIVGRQLTAMRDPHVWLKVGDETIPSFARDVAPNFRVDLLRPHLKEARQLGRVATIATLESGATYVLIGTWEKPIEGHLPAIREAILSADAAKGVVVDVRPNSGGDERLAEQIAALFVDAPAVFAKHRVLKDGAFGPVVERTIEPAETRYAGKVAVLMGMANMSSCESFLMMMDVAPRGRSFGETSYGSSGNPQPYDLGNGVTIYLPCWEAQRADGTPIETKGISPDAAVKWTDDARDDEVLLAAMKWLAN